MPYFRNLILEFKSFDLLFSKKDKIVIGTAILFVSLLLVFYYPLTEKIENKALDIKSWFFSHYIYTDVETDTLIIAIDTPSLRAAPHKWPWPRKYWAQILETVSAKLEPNFVILDIYFQDHDNLESKAQELPIAITKSKVTGLVSIFDNVITVNGSKLTMFPPSKSLRKVAKFWGLSEFPIDDDGVVRTFLLYDFRMDKLHISYEALTSKEKQVVNMKKMQQMKIAKAVLNYKVEEKRCSIISLTQILNAKHKLRAFQNKNIIIGATASVLHDYHMTPFGIINGPELICNAIATLKNKQVQFLFPTWQNRLFHLIFGFLLSLISFTDCFKKRWKPILAGITFLPFLLLAYSFFPTNHPPIALTYITFFSLTWLILILQRLNKLNLVQQSLHEAEICGKIQQKFFPSKVLLAKSRIAIGGLCIPYQNAGGDYFDYFAINSNKYFFFLGDVAGHGISASMLTTAAKSIVSIHAKRDSFSITDLFLEINHAILNLIKRRLMSAIGGEVDYENNKLTLYSAGHLPAIIKTKDGIKEVVLPGLPLGVSKRFKLSKPYEIDIPTEGKIFIYSDGFVEAVNWNDEQLGFDEFYAMIEKMPIEYSVEESIKYLYEQLDTFVEERPYQDDVTVLIANFDQAKGEEQ